MYALYYVTMETADKRLLWHVSTSQKKGKIAKTLILSPGLQEVGVPLHLHYFLFSSASCRHYWSGTIRSPWHVTHLFTPYRCGSFTSPGIDTRWYTDKTPLGQKALGQNPLGQNPLGQNPLGQNPLPLWQKWTKPPIFYFFMLTKLTVVLVRY